MAAKADDSERVDLAPRSITSLLDGLPSLADDWAALSQDERLAWSLEWGNEMAKLHRLAKAEAAGRLNRPRGVAFRSLTERTVGALALIQRLDLRQPSALVLEIGGVRTAASGG
jgi:hypothetical protein